MLSVVGWVAFVMSAGSARAVSVPCSSTGLVNAVQAAVTAGGAQTLDLAPACTYTLTAVSAGAGTLLASGFAVIDKVTLTINGNGATIARDSAAPQFRYFEVGGDGWLNLSHLTLSGGRAPGDGGAIETIGGHLRLDSVTLTHNRAGDALSAGGSGGRGGAIASQLATISIANSTITANSAGNGGDGAGSAVGGSGGLGGGIWNHESTLEITNSSVSNNTAGRGGSTATTGGNGGSGGGLFVTAVNSQAPQLPGFFSMVGSAVSGNAAGNGGSGGTSGGEGGNGGGAFISGSSNVSIANSTISGNVAGSQGTGGNPTGGAGGGVFANVVTGPPDPMNPPFGRLSVLTYCTIAYNGSPGPGGNIAVGLNPLPLGLDNTIVASAVSGDNCSGPLADGFFNLDTGTSCGLDPSESSQNPNLGPLQDNGGPTFTHALMQPSNAIGNADSVACLNPPVNGTDQRGYVRPDAVQSGLGCSIGAYEYNSSGPPAGTATPTVEGTVTSTPTLATATPTLSPSQAPEITPTPSPTPTNPAPPAPTATNIPTSITAPTSTPAPSVCVGDCSGDGQVTVDEILTMVNIALGNAQVDGCLAGDANHDGQITVDEILTAVNAALNGCPVNAINTVTVTATTTATFTSTPTEIPTPTATPTVGPCGFQGTYYYTNPFGNIYYDVVTESGDVISISEYSNDDSCNLSGAFYNPMTGVVSSKDVSGGVTHCSAYLTYVGQPNPQCGGCFSKAYYHVVTGTVTGGAVTCIDTTFTLCTDYPDGRESCGAAYPYSATGCKPTLTCVPVH